MNKNSIIKRNSICYDILKKNASVLILGPRGTGKSHYINNILGDFQNSSRIDLLSHADYKKYARDSEKLAKEVDLNLSKNDSALIFIDEIQLVPKLLNEIHRLIEKYNQRLQFILTGSSARKLKREETNLLAGRAIYIPFNTLSFDEVDFRLHLENILQYGLLPKAFITDDVQLKTEYLKTYCFIYLKEEIQQESRVRNLEAFEQFLELAAFANGEIINRSKIARTVGVSDQIVRDYYQILQDTLIVTKIPAWTNSIRKQLQKSAKFYFFDNGVLNALKGELGVELNPATYRYGRLFENLVINEILKRNKKYDYKIFHYRTNHGSEIDIIMQKNINSPPIAIEIKSSKYFEKNITRPLIDFRDEFSEAKCLVLSDIDKAYVENGIEFLSFYEGIDQIFT